MARDLKLDEVQKPAWWSAAVYELQPSGNWRFTGYLQPKWETWGEYMRRIPMGALHVRTYAYRHTGQAGAQWEPIR